MAKQRTVGNQSSLLDILNLAAHYPTGANLCRMLSIADLISLTRTCRALSGLYRDLIPSQWNIDKLLMRFLDNPKSFRGLMAKHDVLISGSLAIQFFQRFAWPSSDMDVYVTPEGAPVLERYLCEAEGYKVERMTVGDDYNMTKIDRVRTLTKQRVVGNEVQIQLCVSDSAMPVKAILCSFSSTVVTNLISWEKAYALFPQATFIDQQGVLFQHNSPLLDEHIRKYRRRGYRFVGAFSGGGKSSLSIKEARRIGDPYSWIIRLDTVGVANPENYNWSLEYAGFRLDAAVKDALSDEIIPGVEPVRLADVSHHALHYHMCAPYGEWEAFYDGRIYSWIEREVLEDRECEPWENEIPKWFAEFQELQSRATDPRRLLES